MQHLIREYHIDPWQLDCGIPELKAMVLIDIETARRDEERMREQRR